MEILELLDAKGVHYVHKNKEEVAIVCPNEASHGGGRDSRPSFNINIERHVAGCFACGFSLRGDSLLHWLTGGNLDKLDMRTMSIRAKIKQLSHEEEAKLSEARKVFIPPGTSWEEDFRGISKETYRRLEAVHCDNGFYENRLVFPVRLSGELIGVDARALLPDMQPKYLRNKGSSCATDWLYPYDIVRDMRPTYVIIAEGIFHAVNAVDKGFPALCFFGSNNFSRSKLRMLLALNVEYIIYFRDNDKPGMKAEQEICTMIQDWLPVYSADTSRIPEGKDLGDLSAEDIRFAVENKTKPVLPLCLPDTSPKVGDYCSKKKCTFCIAGRCANPAW